MAFSKSFLHFYETPYKLNEISSEIDNKCNIIDGNFPVFFVRLSFSFSLTHLYTLFVFASISYTQHKLNEYTINIYMYIQTSKHTIVQYIYKWYTHTSNWNQYIYIYIYRKKEEEKKKRINRKGILTSRTMWRKTNKMKQQKRRRRRIYTQSRYGCKC